MIINRAANDSSDWKKTLSQIKDGGLSWSSSLFLKNNIYCEYIIPEFSVSVKGFLLPKGSKAFDSFQPNQNSVAEGLTSVGICIFMRIGFFI